MKEKNEKPEIEIIVSLNDFWTLCKRSKRKMISCGLFFACLLVVYRLMSPIEYQATASFREKGKSQAGVATSLTAMLMSANGNVNNSEAAAVMKSRMLLERLIRKLGLQATIAKNEPTYPTLSAIRDNLFIEYAMFRKVPGPLLPDPQPAIFVKDIFYKDEVPTSLKIKFNADDNYQVYFRSQQIGTGKLGNLFSYEGIAFSLFRTQKYPVPQGEYILTIFPMNDLVQMILAKLNIESDKEDRSLLNLKYNSRDRYQAAKILNTLMFSYQEFLREEQGRIISEQMDYLNTRHDDLRGQLQEMMDAYGQSLSNDVNNNGCLGAEQSLAFLNKTQQEYTQDLYAIDLELKRLQQLGPESTYYERYGDGSRGSTINLQPVAIAQIASQIRSLKQQADSLELALQETLLSEQEDLKNHVSTDIADLSLIQQLSKDSKKFINLLNEQKIPDENDILYRDPRYQVKEWCEVLKNNPDCKENFKAYLTHLDHLFEVHQKAIEEQLVHHQSIQEEFQGIDMETARELYMTYSRELVNVQAEERQKKFILEQMKDVDFEISSLGSVLKDSVTERMINHASDILLSLRDQNNRSQKEQERLKNELNVQKAFLSGYLNQTIQVSQLREKLLKEKIRSLQRATLALIQHEISVLQQHLADQVKIRIGNLQQERDVIHQHQDNLQKEIIKLPTKLVTERMLDHQTEMNKTIVEEVTKLVESKNISNNLEMIQSAPLDLAQAPIQPKPPRLLLVAAFGAGLGVFFGLGITISESVRKGIPITDQNLKATKLNSIGTLSNAYAQGKILADPDLKVLRSIANFFEDQKSVCALLLLSRAIDYSKELATLMQKQGKKVLVLSLKFDSYEDHGSRGLLHYLEHIEKELPIRHEAHFDFCPSGGITRFSSEYLKTPHFAQLLKDLKSKYDCILAVTNSSFGNAEIEGSFPLFDKKVVTIKDQTWSDFKNSMQYIDANMTFLIMQ